MPTLRQFVLDEGVVDNGKGDLGKRSQKKLNASFPASPLHGDGKIYSSAEREAVYFAHLSTINVLGKIEPEGQPATSAIESSAYGNGFDKFSTLYAEGAESEVKPPDFVAMSADTENFGNGGGQPTTPYIPPLVSSPDGDASSQLAYSGEEKDLPDGGPTRTASTSQFGSGYTFPPSPLATSANMDNVTAELKGTIGSYIKGSSYKGSDGSGE